uniref:Putative secreted protein n=1 Tax=Anopheles darlingi TaxID=43151 RepID=A0A2M4DRY6_ANODA
MGPTAGISMSLILFTRRCCAYLGSVACPLSIGGALTRLFAAAARSWTAPSGSLVLIPGPGTGGGADVGGGRWWWWWWCWWKNAGWVWSEPTVA